MITKFMVKDLNLECLREEIANAGLPEQSNMLIAGFHLLNKRTYNPFRSGREVIATATGQPDTWAEPGELQFRYDPELTSAQEDDLDRVLMAHQATNLSRMQINQDQDVLDCEAIAENYRNWSSLNNPAKDENARLVARLICRNQDRSLDL